MEDDVTDAARPNLDFKTGGDKKSNNSSMSLSHDPQPE